MKVFISWSKPRSKQLGLILRDWIPDVIQEVDPWMSSADIDKGQRWATELANRLGENGQGLLCVTPENQHEPWLNYEAGALAKLVAEARVRPVLLDLGSAQVTGPLAQFQATDGCNQDDMRILIRSLNEACAAPLDNSRLDRSFDRLWDGYLATVHGILADRDGQVVVSRPPGDLLSEVLDRVREVQRSLDCGPGTGRSATTGRPASRSRRPAPRPPRDPQADASDRLAEVLRLVDCAANSHGQITLLANSRGSHILRIPKDFPAQAREFVSSYAATEGLEVRFIQERV